MHTDSDEFMLGARLSQVHELDYVLRNLRSMSNPPADVTEDIRNYSSSAKTYANEIRALQKKLGINDAALAEAQTIFKQAAALTTIRELLSSYETQAASSNSATPVSTAPVSLESSQFITITQSVSIGGVLLPAGSHVQFVSREGSEVHVRYIGGEYTIPISATDLK